MEAFKKYLQKTYGIFQGGGVVILEDEIGDGPLTFILILKSCGVCG